jgi:hypothetical protein
MQTQTYDVMMKFAHEQRRENESDAQAFSRYAQSPEGRELFAKHQSEQLGDSVSYTPPGSVAVAKSMPPSTLWTGLVSGIQRIAKCSQSQAIDMAMRTEEGRLAFKVSNAAEMAKNYDASDTVYYRAEVDAHLGAMGKAAKSTTLSEYERLVEETLAKFPQMTRSDAMERVRALNPEAWLKFKEMMPDGGDPMDAPVSGKPAPRHETMFDSPMSGSQQNAGRDVRPGPQPSDAVRFKREDDRCVRAVADVFKSIADDGTLSTGAKLRLMDECIRDANAFLGRAA